MKRFAIGLFAAAALVVGCGSDSSFVQNSSFTPTTPQGRSLKQIEQLARPGINEALLFTNAFLNTYNAVSPAFVVQAKINGTPEQQAAQPLLNEAVSTLTAFRTVGGNTSLFDVNKSVAVFLPDVMRVDSSLFLPAAGAYATLSPVNNFPVGGRRLLDDVIDITYAVLVTPGLSDNVSYNGTATNPATGHQALDTNFPYLAPAN